MRTRAKILQTAILQAAAVPLIALGMLAMTGTPALAAGSGKQAAINADKDAANAGMPTPTLTAAQQRQLNAKEAAAKALYAMAFGHGTAPAICEAAVRVAGVKPACGGGAPAPSYSITGNQVAQINNYYCGPATLVEAVGAEGISISQATAASRLGTTQADGTSWYLGSGNYPMVNALNYYLGSMGATYSPVSLPDSPTAAQKSAYEANLVADIWSDWTFAANADESASGSHLTGHPAKAILHWVEVRGYTNSGADTMYEDSVHNATSVSWYASVPAYSTFSSSTFVTILGGRGYVF